MSGSLGSILSIARSGLLAHQKAASIAGQNIANAATPGYSRQRALLTEGPATLLPQGFFGTGVRVVDVERLRDSLLDVAYRAESGIASGFGERAATLGAIEAALGDLTGGGLAAAFDAFYAGFGDLANDPQSPAARAQLQEQGRAIADAFHTAEGAIRREEGTAAQRLSLFAEEANRLTANIADLNGQIVGFESSGLTAGDMRDQRDVMIDRLAEILPVNVVNRSDGSVGVYVNGFAVADGPASRPLSVTSVAGVWSLATPNGAALQPGSSGSAGALLQLLNVDLPGQRASLDVLAASFVDAVNTIHQTGTNPNGNTGVDFFDAAGTTARGLTLSAAVAGDAGEIAAGTPSGTGQYQAGENDVALQLAGLRDVGQGALAGQTFGSYYGDFVSRLGTLVSSARSGADVHETMRVQSDIRRSEISGVSIDEEMVDLIRHQEAFVASTRLVTVADEMIQSILAMV